MSLHRLFLPFFFYWFLTQLLVWSDWLQRHFTSWCPSTDLAQSVPCSRVTVVTSGHRAWTLDKDSHRANDRKLLQLLALEPTIHSPYVRQPRRKTFYFGTQNVLKVRVFTHTPPRTQGLVRRLDEIAKKSVVRRVGAWLIFVKRLGPDCFGEGTSKVLILWCSCFCLCPQATRKSNATTSTEGQEGEGNGLINFVAIQYRDTDCITVLPLVVGLLVENGTGCLC